MKRKLYVLVFVLMTLFLGYCTKDLVEPDISKQWVYIVSPSNWVTSSSPTQTFWWKPVDGARTYELEIVSPSFTNSNLFILDTVITGTKYVYTLPPGKTYQWRVQAQNSVYVTPFTTYTLTIDSTSNLSSQTVVFSNPASSTLYTNAASINFQWNPVISATAYDFQIINQATSLLLKDSVMASTSYLYPLSPGSYTVKVRAQNASSNSPYTSIAVLVNRTPPGAPTLLSPANAASITGNDTLVWARATGAVKDSIYIASDSLFTSPTAGFPVLNNTTLAQYVFRNAVSGSTYYWKLKSADLEGNWSVFSAIRKFKQN
jgi:hypothetical protein